MHRRGRPRHPDILTPREWEVLELIRRGHTNREIADALAISLAGVKFHVSEILGKLGLSSREEAARWRPHRALLPWFGSLRRALGSGIVRPALLGGCAVGVAVTAVLVFSALQPSDAPVALLPPGATPAPTAASPFPATSVDLRVLPSIEEAQALATFPILQPATLPNDYRLAEVRYYKPDLACPQNLDPGQCARAHNDFVEVRYTKDTGESLTIAQGFGSSSSGGASYRFAPASSKGTLTIDGREARWVTGSARRGAFHLGGDNPFSEEDWIRDSHVSLTWVEFHDTNPSGGDSPRCISLYSTSLPLETLVSIASSLPPQAPLRPTGPRC